MQNNTQDSKKIKKTAYTKQIQTELQPNIMSSSKLQPTRGNVSWFICFLQTLYVLQAVPPPIIRST